MAGTMLQELAPTQATEVAQAPRGWRWRYSVERKATRVPERKHQGTGRAGCCRKGRDQGLKRIGALEEYTTLPPIVFMSTQTSPSAIAEASCCTLSGEIVRPRAHNPSCQPHLGNGAQRRTKHVTVNTLEPQPVPPVVGLRVADLRLDGIGSAAQADLLLVRPRFGLAAVDHRITCPGDRSSLSTPR